VGAVSGRGRREIDAVDQLVTPVGSTCIRTTTARPPGTRSSRRRAGTASPRHHGELRRRFRPGPSGQEQFLIELMESVEDIRARARGRARLAVGILSAVPGCAGAQVPRIDVGTQVPHAAVRAYVMGERCNSQEDLPTDAELAQMQALVREGIAAGALGFSSSRTLLHKDKYGVHMPGTFAGSDEMLALGLSMKGLSHGCSNWFPIILRRR